MLSKIRSRSKAWVSLALFVTAGWLVLASADTRDRYHVILLHTNDVHGQAQPRPATWLDRENPPPIGGLPRLAAEVNRVRKEAQASGAGFLLVDGGDWYQGTPEGLLEHGRSFVGAMQLLDYDAIAVGNHEYDHGVEALAGMIAEAKVPALSANVYAAQGGERVDWCEPYKVVQVGEMRVGIVGLLTPVTPSITHKDASALYFEEPAEALARARKELDGRVDWVLPITHLGVTDDRRLAKAHPDLGLIVGGHSHTYLKNGVKQGETLIVQSGSKASAVGRVDLWFDAETFELLECSGQLIDLLKEPAAEDRNARVDEICATLVKRGEAQMNEVVGTLAEPFVRKFRKTHSSPGGNFIADRMRETLEADVAFQNRGGIRCDLKQGPLTRRGLFELLPFGNHLVLLEMSGADLEACFRASVEGTAHTGLEVSGVTILWSEIEGGYAYEGLEVGGKPVDVARKYRVATNNFLAGGGDGYGPLKDQVVLREDPRRLRDILEEYFGSVKEVRLPAEDRYRSTER